jgi:flagellar basal-body rod protein FlgB
MITRLDDALGRQEAALTLRAQRQQLIASNIANADTPNYKAVDLNFAEALKRAQAGQPVTGSPPLLRTVARHLPPIPVAGGPAGAVDETASALPSVDGNTVDLDAEQARFAENTVRYEAAFRVLNGKLRSLLAAMQQG